MSALPFKPICNFISLFLVIEKNCNNHMKSSTVRHHSRHYYHGLLDEKVQRWFDVMYLYFVV